jgi:hypothetical protein
MQKNDLKPNLKEDNMEQALLATQLLSNLGLFLLGIGVLWFVSVYKDKNK